VGSTLRVAVINPPFPSPTRPGQWITVPPEGYGGVQWVAANLLDGLLALGHEVFLLGAPASRSFHPRLTVIPAATQAEIKEWVGRAYVDIVHDHTNGIVGPEDTRSGVAYLSTHHLTGQPRYPGNCVYLSAAQRRNAGATDRAPVIRIPVNVSRYEIARRKGDFLLFLGRVSAHKGALEAAAFARAAGLPVVIAGPSWEPEYRAQVEATGGASVKFLGEIGGRQRLDLLARARAVLVLSQPKAGPWGGTWCEPGATVVSEAAASGTPVIATFNGCLPEIVPQVGHLVPFGTAFDPAAARELLKAGPEPAVLRSAAGAQWGHVRIASQYLDLYQAVISGACWQ